MTAAASRNGRVVPATDGLIAATALHHGLKVMTRNIDDFAPTGAEVLNPWAATGIHDGRAKILFPWFDAQSASDPNLRPAINDRAQGGPPVTCNADDLRSAGIEPVNPWHTPA